MALQHLTFIALIHLIDAATAILFNNPLRLFQIYPGISNQLQQIPTNIYLLAATATTITFWAATCLTAFDSPLEAFLNKIIADAKQQNTIEAQILEGKSELFDLMYETIESDGQILAQVKDLMRSIRAEVKDIQPIKRNNRENTRRAQQPKKGNKNFRGTHPLHLSLYKLRHATATRLQALPLLRRKPNPARKNDNGQRIQVAAAATLTAPLTMC